MIGTKLAFALCGSFCSFNKILPQMESLKEKGYDILPIMSENAYSTDTRFGTAKEFIDKVEGIAGKKIIHSIIDSEPLGPKNLCDIMLIAPCTGNTLAKIGNGITDTSVTMAAKSLLRVGKPIVIALSTNDALGISAQNLGKVINYKNIYLVPLSQDDPQKKPNSLVAHFKLIKDTLEMAINKKQIQPIFR